VEVLRQDARIALPTLAERGRRFDVIYLDPPYESDLYEPLLQAIARGGLLEEGGVVVAEHFKKRALPETIDGLSQTRVVRVGDHALGFYAWREGGSAS
jgi:16S rRNA G966 N2-methylase RsmD